MPRRNLLPNYISQPAWVDLCNAIDAVFSSRVDSPTKALGKIRRRHNLSPVAKNKIEDGVLIRADELDIFEREVLIKQVNTIGLLITSQGYFSQQELVRIFRGLSQFWYSKGTIAVADFISYIFNMPITFERLWTEDYVDFEPEGSSAIGTPIYQGGTWYPTTHCRITVSSLDLPGGIPLEIFATLIQELVNYPMVPIYVLETPDLYITSTNGAFLPLIIGTYQRDTDVLANFELTANELNPSTGAGGFEPITTIPLPAPYGSGYVKPPVPVMSFTSAPVGDPNSLTVQFTNTSTTYVDSSVWFFLTPETPGSYERSPTFTFPGPGLYQVRLFGYNESGFSSTTVGVSVGIF